MGIVWSLHKAAQPLHKSIFVKEEASYNVPAEKIKGEVFYNDWTPGKLHSF